MVSCLMGDSTALASAIVRCCLKNGRKNTRDNLPDWKMGIVFPCIKGFYLIVHSYFLADKGNDRRKQRKAKKCHNQRKLRRKRPGRFRRAGSDLF